MCSTCPLNLSTDKPAVLAEMFRVLRPGGRIGISDVVTDDALTPADRAERGSYVGCIAGALSFTEYTAGLREVGFTDVSVTPTHQAADGMHAAIIRATRPVDAPASPAARRSAALRCSPDASRASHGLLRSPTLADSDPDLLLLGGVVEGVSDDVGDVSVGE